MECVQSKMIHGNFAAGAAGEDGVIFTQILIFLAAAKDMKSVACIFIVSR